MLFRKIELQGLIRVRGLANNTKLLNQNCGFIIKLLENQLQEWVNAFVLLKNTNIMNEEYFTKSCDK